MLSRIRRVSSRLINLAQVLILGFLLLGSSSLQPEDRTEQVRAFTRQIEFDYVSWTLGALRFKLVQLSLGAERYLSNTFQHQLVLEYLDLISQIQQAEAQLYSIFSDPTILDPQTASREVRVDLQALYDKRGRLQPLAEAILQDQLSATVSRMGLTLGGQPVVDAATYSAVVIMVVVTTLVTPPLLAWALGRRSNTPS